MLTLVAPGPRSPEHKLIGRATQVVFVTEDVLAKFREWRQRGVRFRHSPRLRRVKYERGAKAGPAADSGSPSREPAPVWGGVFTRFEDIDGNSFALVSFDEESRAVEAQRRAAAEKRESERRASHELEIARQVQARLFPQRLPRSTTLDYAGLCIQARRVGGDYYDFLDLGEERIGFVVGDIAGKGMAAALLMANLQANLRSQVAAALHEPERFLRSVNQLFFENTADSDYATLFFAEYDDRERRLRYANCGHLGGLLLRGDGTLERLVTTGTVLGLFEAWECSIGERRLAPGDLFVLYTDGVTEAHHRNQPMFGQDRLIEVIREVPGDVDTVADAILAAVTSYGPAEPRDDVAVVVGQIEA